ncbi:MAG: chorismate lyase [Proteobacteria bacterium]|nr:chorismate lyase [Pseudomonadota bacterium]
MSHSGWTTDLTKLNPLGQQSAWLTKPYILSKALKRVSNTLTVKVLDARFTHAFDDEYPILHLQKNDIPFVRQVLLVGDNNIPLTYGRVVITPQTYKAHFQDFENLGTKPIGETLLYNNPEAKRSGFEFSCFESNDPLCQNIFAHLPQFTAQDLWARRSVFNIKGNPLLVTELFLPSLPAYVPEQSNVA